MVIIIIIIITIMELDSAVDTKAGYELDNRGVGVRVTLGARIFFSPCRPGWLLGPPILSSERWGSFPGG
jgi:hypothetical protein